MSFGKRSTLLLNKVVFFYVDFTHINAFSLAIGEHPEWVHRVQHSTEKWVSTGINGHGYGLGVALLALSYQHLCGF